VFFFSFSLRQGESLEENREAWNVVLGGRLGYRESVTIDEDTAVAKKPLAKAICFRSTHCWGYDWSPQIPSSILT